MTKNGDGKEDFGFPAEIACHTNSESTPLRYLLSRLASDSNSSFFHYAEEAANFGREIGLQYVHAHIRYIEAMCNIGLTSKAYEAILQILPTNWRCHGRRLPLGLIVLNYYWIK